MSQQLTKRDGVKKILFNLYTFMITIHFLGVLVAAIVAFIIGFLAHGPVAGKLWMKLANIQMTGNEKFADMIPQMVYNFIVNVICAYVLAFVYSLAVNSSFLGGAGVLTGVMTALILWVGFNFTATSIEVIWMGRSRSLWIFECVSSFVVFAAMGAVIALM